MNEHEDAIRKLALEKTIAAKKNKEMVNDFEIGECSQT